MKFLLKWWLRRKIEILKQEVQECPENADYLLGKFPTVYWLGKLDGLERALSVLGLISRADRRIEFSRRQCIGLTDVCFSNNQKLNMGYWGKKQEVILSNRNVLDIALEVHMATTGSSEIPKEDLDNYKKILTEIVKNWEPSIPMCQKFDDAVKNLIQVALEESP